jgi:hypothetical protein
VTDVRAGVVELGPGGAGDSLGRLGAPAAEVLGGDAARLYGLA